MGDVIQETLDLLNYLVSIERLVRFLISLIKESYAEIGQCAQWFELARHRGAAGAQQIQKSVQIVDAGVKHALDGKRL